MTDKPTPQPDDLPTTGSPEEWAAAFRVGKVEPDPGLAKRLWLQWAETIITVAIVGLYLIIWFLFGIISDVRHNQKTGAERGFKSRAVACQSLIVDNDRSFALTDDCTEPNVMKFLPPEVCRVMGATQADGCGTEFAASPFKDLALG